MFKNQITAHYITLLSITLLVGIYQLPTIENTASKYNIEMQLNEKFHFSQDLQQFLENTKINLSSYLDSSIVESKKIEVQNKIEVQKNHVYEVNTEKTYNSLFPFSNMEDHNQYINLLNKDINLTKIDIKTDKINSNEHSENDTHAVSKSDNTIPTQVCTEKCTVLMIGDSVMGDISFALQRLLKKQHPGWIVIDAHKVSSGLSNQTYYNWPLTAKKLVEQYKPHYTFVLFGTNDAQNLINEGKARAFGKIDWQEAYSQRVTEITKLLDNNNQYWGWIQLPVVKDTGFNNRLQIIRDIQKEKTNTHFIVTENIFGDNKHNENIDMKLRANDGTHLNSNGANLLANHLYKQINSVQ